MKHFYLTLVLEFKDILYFIWSVFSLYEITSERSWRPNSISWNPWRQVKNSFFFDTDEGHKQPHTKIIVLFGYRVVRGSNIHDKFYRVIS